MLLNNISSVTVSRGSHGNSLAPGALKTREWKTREWATRHEMTRVDKAGVDNAGVEKDKGMYVALRQRSIQSYMQFLSAVSHSMSAHTEALRPTEDSSSSSSEDDDSNQATPAEATVSTATRRDDCCEVCLVAPREGFALVPCGRARFCESLRTARS